MSKKLDYNKPIIAINKEGTKYLLVPTLEEGGYGVKGWDWLNMDTMEHNSYRHWRTKKEAVKAYSYYKIYNARITRSHK